MTQRDHAAAHEARLLQAVTDNAKAIRPTMLVVFEAATMAADQSTDPVVRKELLELKAETADALAAIDEWLTVFDDAGTFDDEPPDPQIERDRRDYEAGKAQAEMRRAERKMYGSELADAFHAQDDLNAYNRGDDD